MFVAAWTVHRKNGFFIVKEGWEYNLILAVAAVAIAGTGAGKLSLDYALFTAARLCYDYLHGWCGLLIARGAGPGGGIGQLVDLLPPAAPAEGRRLRLTRCARISLTRDVTSED